MSLLLTYYYIKQCLTYHLDRTRQWSKLETLVSKWPTLHATPFLSSEVTFFVDVHIWFYIHLLQYQISLIFVIIMFFACQNKKSKIHQEFAKFCKISLFICFICFSYYIIFIFAGGGSLFVWLLDLNYLCNQYLSHVSCEIEPHSWRGVLDTTLCD